MFHGRQINDKMNKLHERGLRIVYNDTITPFENLLIKGKSFTIHHQNIQSLAIEIYKAIHNTAKNIVISPSFLVWKFCGRHSFRIVLGESCETMRKLCLFTKFTHQQIK